MHQDFFTVGFYVLLILFALVSKSALKISRKYSSLYDDFHELDDEVRRLKKERKHALSVLTDYHKLRRAYYNLTNKKIVPAYQIFDKAGRFEPDLIDQDDVDKFNALDKV